MIRFRKADGSDFRYILYVPQQLLQCFCSSIYTCWNPSLAWARLVRPSPSLPGPLDETDSPRDPLSALPTENGGIVQLCGVEHSRCNRWVFKEQNAVHVRRSDDCFSTYVIFYRWFELRSTLHVRYLWSRHLYHVEKVQPQERQNTKDGQHRATERSRWE